MSSVAVQSHLTPAEYLALERKATMKNEYFDGQIYAMSGASRAQNLIVANLLSALHTQLSERDCEVYANDMRVKIDVTGLYTYPDVLVVCDEPRFEDASLDTLLNPTVLVEVLSPSTEAYDRGEKFSHYRHLESLQEYVLVAQNCIRVEHYLRQEEKWLLTEFDESVDLFRLPSINCELSTREIYAKVKLSTDALRQQEL